MAPSRLPGPLGHGTHHPVGKATKQAHHPAPVRHTRPTRPAPAHPPGTVTTHLTAAEKQAADALAMVQWKAAKATVTELFTACLNPKTSISEEAWKKAAKQLDVEVELIKAVARVESPRGPYDDDGHPTILFERHYFHNLTGGKYDKKHPKISAKSAGGYGKFSAQYGKLEEAYLLDASAALQSASWGKFQIMGKNYKKAGFAHVEEMVAAMMASEENQLTAFVTFVGSDAGMKKALKDKNWAGFASRYNGKGYKKNSYDVKMKEAYEAEKKKTQEAEKKKAAAAPTGKA